MASRLMKVYEVSPRFIQTTGINIIELGNWATDHSKITRQFLEAIKDAQTWSNERFLDYQSTRLREMVRFAYENVPFYKRLYDQHGIDVSTIRTPNDLKKLPIITKENVRKSYDDLISRKKIKYKMRYTSGTTVTPLKVKVSSDAIMINRAASMLRDQWAGYDGDRVARFVGDHPVTNCMDRCLHRRSFVMNRLIYPPNCLSINNSREVLRSLRDKKIKILQCYPSAGYILAKFLEKYNEHLPLKAILYSSEPLHSYERELMEERFQTKAYGFYGQAECVFSALECEKGGYHLSMLDGILEITRGEESVEPGEYGSTVVTSLWNKAMPLIRYRLDDYTGYTNEACSCGRTTPTIYPIESKIDDLVITPSGRIVTPLSITCPLKSAKNVLECQIVQKSIDSITLRIVPLPGFSTEDETALHGIFKSVLGEDFSLSIEKVSRIHSTTAGKKRRVINEMSGDIFERGFTDGRRSEHHKP